MCRIMKKPCRERWDSHANASITLLTVNHKKMVVNGARNTDLLGEFRGNKSEVYKKNKVHFRSFSLFLQVSAQNPQTDQFIEQRAVEKLAYHFFMPSTLSVKVKWFFWECVCCVLSRKIGNSKSQKQAKDKIYIRFCVQYASKCISSVRSSLNLTLLQRVCRWALGGLYDSMTEWVHVGDFHSQMGVIYRRRQWCFYLTTPYMTRTLPRSPTTQMTE